MIGRNPLDTVPRSGWRMPGVSAARMPPSSLHGRIHGVPRHVLPGPNPADCGRRVTHPVKSMAKIAAGRKGLAASPLAGNLKMSPGNMKQYDNQVDSIGGTRCAEGHAK